MMKYRKQLLEKLVHIDKYSLVACALILFATGLRLTLIALGWPPLDSDEGTMGIMAMHIAFKGEWPAYFYGQGYMGTLEAYVAAIFFHLIGVSTFSLLLGLALMYTGFLVAIYRLTALLYSRGLALVTLLLLSLGSNPMFSRELVAIGGYPETLFFGALLLLLASWLALTSSQSQESRGEQRRRLAAYTGWGLIAGLGIWTHLLTLPFIFLSGLLILLFCWRELRGWSLVGLLVALLLGMLPMLIYNIGALMWDPGRDTLSYMLKVHSAAGVIIPPGPPLFLRQLWGAFMISMPTMTGAVPLCSPSQVDFLHPNHAVVPGCMAVHAGWSLGAVILWGWALLLALGALWQSRGVWWGKGRRDMTLEERTGVVLQTARLALLGTGGLTFLLYVISPDAGLFAVATSRYLVGLLVSLPAVLWPLWRGAFRPSAREMAAQSRPSLTGGPTFLMGTRSAGGEPDGLCIPTPNDASESTAAQSGDREGIPRKGGPYISWGRGIYGGVRQGVILLVGVIYLVGTLSIFTGYPPAPQLEQRWGIFATQVNDQHLDLATVRALNERQYSLIRHLLQARIVHIYSDYWTCNRLIFQSKERIICAVIDLNKYNNRLLRTGQNRYLPYLEEVRADKHETYVLELGSPLVLAFESIHPKRTYHYRIFDGYGIYQIIS